VTGRLYLVRHGETAGDEGGDPGLSERGVAQARALAARLRSRSITDVWHGPRRRAAETAAIAASVLGVGEARSSGLLDDRTPVPSAARAEGYPAARGPWFEQVPAEERDEDGVQLTAAWRQLVCEAAADRELLLVTHAFVVAWFVREVLRAPASAWTNLLVANTGLTVVGWDRDGAACVEAFNDTGHLEAWT
jgi:broad specificity phosphatase PhoE